MTPEEIVEKINEYVFWDEVDKPDGYAMAKVLELIQQAKSEWCKEQRENCLKAWETAPCDEFEGMSILNAPEP